MTTWNPSDKATDIVLSNGNLSATNGVAAWESVRATTSKSTGKYMFMVTNTNGISDWFVGVATSAGTLASWMGNLGGVSCGSGPGSLYYEGGITNPGDALIPSYGGTAGDSVGVAIDFDAGNIWMCDGSGAFTTYSTSANPAGGTHPMLTFTANTALFPGGTHGGTTGVITLVPTPSAGLIPSGFSPWDPAGDTLRGGQPLLMMRDIARQIWGWRKGLILPRPRPAFAF